MEKKFITVIDEVNGQYAVVLQCYTTDEGGQRTIVASEVENVADYPASIVLANDFYQNNKH